MGQCVGNCYSAQVITLIIVHGEASEVVILLEMLSFITEE